MHPNSPRFPSFLERFEPPESKILRNLASYPKPIGDGGNSPANLVCVHLNLLLNSKQKLLQIDPRLTHVKQSVLTYGPRQYTQPSNIEAAGKQGAQAIHDAIIFFEPRIDPRTLRVTPIRKTPNRQEGRTEHAGAFEFQIDGDVWTDGAQQHLRILAAFDPVAERYHAAPTFD